MANKKNRRTGYCPICDSNVVHTRTFENRIAYRLDRLSLGVLGWFHVGPWRCVDCSHRQMFVQRDEYALREISDAREADDEKAPVGNFLRTRESLAHAVSDGSRFSEKFRAGVVAKLLDSRTTVSRVCAELGVSELEIQQWIRAWVESEMRRIGNVVGGDTVESGKGDGPDQWPADIRPEGPVIESQAIRRPG